MAQVDTECQEGQGVAADAEGQTDGSLPILRGERELPVDQTVFRRHPSDDLEMAEPAEPAKVVQLGRVPGVPGPLPAADAARGAQLLHAVVRTVRLTEEPDAGNLQVRFREGH